MERSGTREERLARMLREKRRSLLLELGRELDERMAEEDIDRHLEQIEIGDRATSIVGQDVELGVLEMKRREVAQIDGALRRLGTGDYGTCDECGEAIDVDRLEILPFATQCVDCKRRNETSAVSTQPTGWGFRSGFGDLRDEGGDDEA